jgi:thiamine kinase-like enzyme
MRLKTSLKINFKNIENELYNIFQSKTPYTISPLKGGGNNQVFLIKTIEYKFLLKHYYQDQNKHHSRIDSEYDFIEYAYGIGLNNIPKPIKKIKKANIAIFSFLEGKKPTQDNINVEHALDFLIELNFRHEKTKTLVNAKECCFCFQDYLDTVENKFSKLISVTKNEQKIQLLDFLKNSFQPKWERVKQNFILKRSNELQKTFPTDELLISPSDFGFHNAIIDNHKTYFIDFEYAGIDDIAKIICDFFCQPKYPIPLRYMTNFVASLLQFIKNPINCVRRIRDLMPICQMKWCCIILNVFLKDGIKRRKFSNSNETEKNQLEKAKNLLKTVNEEFLWPI